MPRAARCPGATGEAPVELRPNARPAERNRVTLRISQEELANLPGRITAGRESVPCRVGRDGVGSISGAVGDRARSGRAQRCDPEELNIARWVFGQGGLRDSDTCSIGAHGESCRRMIPWRSQAAESLRYSMVLADPRRGRASDVGAECQVCSLLRAHRRARARGAEITRYARRRPMQSWRW